MRGVNCCAPVYIAISRHPRISVAATQPRHRLVCSSFGLRLRVRHSDFHSFGRKLRSCFKFEVVSIRLAASSTTERAARGCSKRSLGCCQRAPSVFLPSDSQNQGKLFMKREHNRSTAVEHADYDGPTDASKQLFFLKRFSQKQTVALSMEGYDACRQNSTECAMPGARAFLGCDVATSLYLHCRLRVGTNQISYMYVSLHPVYVFFYEHESTAVCDFRFRIFFFPCRPH